MQREAMRMKTLPLMYPTDLGVQHVRLNPGATPPGPAGVQVTLTGPVQCPTFKAQMGQYIKYEPRKG